MTRPSALAHADTRKRVPAMDPTLASSSPIDRAWHKRKAGNEPTSLGVTPHGVRDPGTKPTETTANGTTRATECAQRRKDPPKMLLASCQAAARKATTAVAAQSSSTALQEAPRAREAVWSING